MIDIDKLSFFGLVDYVMEIGQYESKKFHMYWLNTVHTVMKKLVSDKEVSEMAGKVHLWPFVDVYVHQRPLPEPVFQEVQPFPSTIGLEHKLTTQLAQKNLQSIFYNTKQRVNLETSNVKEKNEIRNLQAIKGIHKIPAQFENSCVAQHDEQQSNPTYIELMIAAIECDYGVRVLKNQCLWNENINEKRTGLQFVMIKSDDRLMVLGY
ncbi:hypothetical protein E3N88_19141 [Mikania micrantha]|uniref:Uncharacterized protein n=1 Tax=Mikania micrantha TaxID=192012 RepID=A0A5N6NPR1_9ASTR|nr:hypothetical protein E3N88_19141 [Mikania micrantha]